MNLTKEEEKEFERLLRKVKFPLPQNIFEAWLFSFVSLTVEVALLRKLDGQSEIFLTHREDPFFKGWHIPGSVLLPGESIDHVASRVIKEEIKLKNEKPVFFEWFERKKGNKIGESPRGHEVSFLFISSCLGGETETQSACFFPLNKLPADILDVHIPVFERLKKSFS